MLILLMFFFFSLNFYCFVSFNCTTLQICFGSVFCRWSWPYCRVSSLSVVFCFVLYSMLLGKFCLVCLSVLICDVDVDIWRGFACRIALSAFSFMPWFLSFLILVKLFGILQLVILESPVLVFRMLSSGPCC